MFVLAQIFVLSNEGEEGSSEDSKDGRDSNAGQIRLDCSRIFAKRQCSVEVKACPTISHISYFGRHLLKEGSSISKLKIDGVSEFVFQCLGETKMELQMAKNTF